MNTHQFGTVHLVGAGPGDPDLLTVKAQKLISKCDALVYDSLVPIELLELVSSNCQLHSVGKSVVIIRFLRGQRMIFYLI